MNSKGNRVKFARIALLADLYIFTRLEIKSTYCRDQLFFVQCIIKQLLETVFVISRIIKADLDYSGDHKNLIQQLFSNNDFKKMIRLLVFSY